MFNLAFPTTPTSAQHYAVPTERLLAMTAAAAPAGATMSMAGPGSDAAAAPPPSYAMSAVFSPTHNYSFGFNWPLSSSIPAEKVAYTPLSPETPTPSRFPHRLSTELADLNRDFTRRMSAPVPQPAYNMTSSPLSSPSSVGQLSRRGSWASTGSATEDSYEPIRSTLIAPPIALPELPTTLPTPPDVSPRRNRAATITRETTSPDVEIAPPPKRRKKTSKMHPCPECDKSFPRPSALLTHMNVHSGEKPWRCPVSTCAKSFAVRSNARRHMRTHGIGANESPDIAFVPARTSHNRIWRPQSLSLLAPARPYAPALQRSELDSLPDLGLGLSGGWSCLLPPVRPGQGEERDSWAYDSSNPGPYHPSQWNNVLAGPLPPAVYGY